MLKVKKCVDFAMFTFAESSGIDDTMKVLAANGIQIRGVLAWQQSTRMWAAKHGLKGLPNVSLFRAKPGGGMRKLHHKLIASGNRW